MMKKQPDNNTILFDTAFGAADKTINTWDPLSFSDAKPKMDFRYVGWIDVMGASHMMQRSLDAAAKNVGCLHEAVLKARSSLRLKHRPELHPMADGVYVVGRDYTTVCSVLVRAFRSYARICLTIQSDIRLCPIRAAIAYGRVVNHNAVLEKVLEKVGEHERQSFLTSYCFSVLHGSAYVAAHEGERKAPPFGIAHHETVLEFGKTERKEPITWPLKKWWCEGHAANTMQKAFATVFGQRLLDHFDWIESHPFDSGMSGDEVVKKIAAYKKQIKEYFGLCNKPSSHDGTQSNESKLAGQTKRL